MSQQQIPETAQLGQEKVIIRHLAQRFKSQQIRVRLVCKQTNLHVLLEATTPPVSQPCLQLVKQVLQSLELTNIESVRVYGRKLGHKQTLWTKAFCLDVTPPQIIQEVSSNLSDPEKHLSFDNKATVQPASIPRETSSLNRRRNKEQNQVSQPSSRHSGGFLREKPPLLLLALGGVSFLLGSSWDLLNLESFNFAGFVPAFSQSSEVADSVATDPSPVVPETVPEATPTPLPEVPLSKTTVTIKAVGDIIPGTDYPSYRLPPNPEMLFDQVKPYFYGADLVFGNFESTMTDHPYSAKDVSRPAVFAFRTPPDYAQLFQDVGFDVLSVANNHSMDFTAKGFEDTIANFEKVGVTAVGRKGEVSYVDVKDIPVAFVAFSTYAYHNSLHDLETAKALVEEAESQADIVVVSFHGGAEGTGALHVRDQTEYFYGENRGNLVQFSRAMIDAGADLILGHGPHVPRALEVYEDRLIAYSLGNFLGYRSLSTVAQLAYSLILEVEIDQAGNFVRGRIIPVHLEGEGIPVIDQYFRSVSLIRELTESDFPETPITIERDGEIVSETGLQPFVGD